MREAGGRSGKIARFPAMTSSALPALHDRRHLAAFAVGCLLVTAGVLLHLPMYWMGRGDGFRLVDMPMDAEMLWGMAAILVGSALAAWGASAWTSRCPRMRRWDARTGA